MTTLTNAAFAATLIALSIHSSSIGLVQAQYGYNNGGSTTAPTNRPTRSPTNWPTSPPTAAQTTAPASELDCSFRASPVDIEGDGSLLLRHIVNPVEGTVTVQLEYAGIGWLGAGYVTTRSMTPNVAVIGLPDGTSTGRVEKYDLTARDISGVQPLDANRQTLSDATIVQDGSKTILTFTKPLIEDEEVSVAAGTAAIFMWAYGRDNELATHANRGHFDVTIPECVAPGQTSAPVAPTPNAVAPAPAPPTAPNEPPTASSTNGISTQQLGQGRARHCLSALDGVSSLCLTPDEPAGTFTVEMVVAKVAWIAFAFSLDNTMPDSVAVMAFPNDDGSAVPEKWLLGSTKTEAAVTKAPDTQQTLMDVSLVQNDTHTSMTFTKRMTEDGEPTVLTQGQNVFLYAIGRDNDFGIHGTRGDLSLDFANLASGVGGGSGGPPNKALWRVHGIFMFLAWAILVPLGIGASVLRGLLPLPEGMWFQIHRGLNSLAVLLTIIGFAIAVYCIGDEQGDTAKHFQTLKHHKVGLVIFIFALLQALSGIFRPHLPPKPKTEEKDDTEMGAADTVPDAHASTQKSTARVVFEYQHRIIGTLTMILAWYNSNTGIKAFNDRFQGPDLEGVLWAVIAIIVVPTVMLSVYQRTRST